MRLTTLRLDGAEPGALVRPGGAVPLPALNEHAGTDWPVTVQELLETGRVGELRDWVAGRDAAALDGLVVPQEQLAYAPLYRRPRKIWGIGLNYVEHAADLSEKAPSTEPASFLKPDTTIIGPGDAIRIPPQSQRTTAEGELGVVIGRECKDVDEADAPSVVAGFTTIVDMTAEDILEENPRYLTRSKSFDTFFSFGPELVTADEVADVDALEVATIHNGQVHRRNVVSNMTFRPWWLVAFHSRVMTLLPGDVISTGTPGAVHIRSGDTAGVQITGFRELTNPVA
ncbi:2-keto-4-pentenoate hydratase/2-oxohepta-3-ene-1,7-dioic acid hydratase (catechol pathway) [Geodermatophilus pulveris]|uniref:2-keto-4-pentenoate hydratase/2-oxohepta-3-ene-1,7-dioic acid hydratase (Catechol pathway) n=1 Tax=Geodermatophilus pulveris TaxID=1564159 RepID=A0A239I775_9ACTN|nr:fumarylacetoacetate hydrolase family protein [Geodermatophilus pulveris]SNS88923.1 2-keto-4-pentenoate hydratase/2-oxohepta-3-ene-1,7-dioic acid hydratase (catechol pathway) [Geodermatophilus pulveris]